MKKLVLILFVFILILSMFSVCSNGELKEIKGNKKVFVMGILVDYKLYEYVDVLKSDEIIGFDVDVVKYIGKEFGYEVKVKDMDFGGLLVFFSLGKVDFVMVGMMLIVECKNNVDFIDIYFVVKNMVVFKKDFNIKFVEDLKGKKVGV